MMKKIILSVFLYALAVMAFASFQQARLNTTVTIEGNTYTHKAGRNFVSPGIKFALFF